MSLADYQKTNFNTLNSAFSRNRVALVECRLKATKETVPVVCAMNFENDNFVMVPLAIMFTSNPYDILEPPDPYSDDGFYTGEDDEPSGSPEQTKGV